MNLDCIYRIRDSIDIYLSDKKVLVFYFSNTRKSIEFSVSEGFINLISLIDGYRTLNEIYLKYKNEYNQFVNIDDIKNVFNDLLNKNIIYLYNKNLDKYLSNNRYIRQIGYLIELIKIDNPLLIQEKLSNSRITIFGIGSVGGNIAILLAMAGIKNFIFIDYKYMQEDSSVRHIYYSNDYLNINKVEALKNEINKIDNTINIQYHNILLEPNTNILNYISNSDFIINSADYPYIGYTSIKISRECVKLRKPHYIAGGFDLHLASTGELIIPGVTPCSDCYKSYFDVTLKDWKPEKREIIYDNNEMGGFSSLSLFSASFATIQIIKILCGIEDIKYLSRGELDFETYNLSYLNVKRDINCKTCGNL